MGKKTRKIEVLCDTDELKKIHNKAKRLGLKDGQYLRILGLSSRITVREVYRKP
jgi:hypothetical protein